MRRHINSSRSSMITEYQASFLPPSCYKSVTSTSTQKNPYHSLKGTLAEPSTFRAFYVFQNSTKPQSKVSKQLGPSDGHIRARNTAVTNMDYTTVYRNDFRAWKADSCHQRKLTGNLNITRGFTVTDSFKEDPKNVAGKEKSVPNNREQKHFEGISSYRLDYVPHQVQPRSSKGTAVYATNKGPPVSSSPKSTYPQNQEHLKGASKFFQQFENWSLATNLQSKPPAEHNFQSTTHEDTAAPKYHVTKSVLFSMQTSEKTKEPFQVMVNMKECCRAWDGPPCFTCS